MHMNYRFGDVFVYSSAMNHINVYPLLLRLSAYVTFVITA